MTGPLRVEHDPKTGRLALAGRPLRFDARGGSVVAELAAGRFTVRPLSWGGKRSLARWTRLGPAFVMDQTLALCVEEQVPAEEQLRAELFAIVAWLDASSLPLDSPFLSSVTLAVCRNAGLAPADLDRRDAWDVESLWQAAQAETAVVETSRTEAARSPGAAVVPSASSDPRSSWSEDDADADDGVRRIVILPNPEPRATAEAPAPRSAVPASEKPGTARHTESIPTAPEMRPARQTHGGDAHSTRARAARPAPVSQPRAQIGRFRIVTPGAHASSAPSIGGTEPSATPPSRRVTPSPSTEAPEPGARSASDAETATERVQAPSARAEPRETCAIRGAITNALEPSSRTLGRSLRVARPEGTVESRVPHVEPPPLPHVERVELAAPCVAADGLAADALFEELADRLEQAAEDLGIDPGG